MTKSKEVPFQRIIDRLPNNKKNIFQYVTNSTGVEYKYLQALYMGRLQNPKLKNVIVITNCINSMFDENHKVDFNEWVFPAETTLRAQEKIKKALNS